MRSRLAFLAASSLRADSRWRDVTVRQCLNHTGGWDRDISPDPSGIPWEIAKALGVLLIFWLLRAEFDNMRDGIVYGALVGLGFNWFEAAPHVAPITGYPSNRLSVEQLRKRSLRFWNRTPTRNPL